MFDNGTFGTKWQATDRWLDSDGDWYADALQHLVAVMVVAATHLVARCGNGVALVHLCCELCI